MTRDEIAQAMQDSAGNSWGNEAHFQRFAALVAAAERKKLFALLRQMQDAYALASDPSAIRAKGNT